MNLVTWGTPGMVCLIYDYTHIVRDTPSTCFMGLWIIHVFLMNNWRGNCAGHAVVGA